MSNNLPAESGLTPARQAAILDEARGTLSRKFVQQLQAAFEEMGEEAIASVAFNDPDKFLNLIAKVAVPPPQQVEHTAGGTLAEYLQARAQGAFLEQEPIEGELVELESEEYADLLD